jgi:putative membrane protein
MPDVSPSAPGLSASDLSTLSSNELAALRTEMATERTREALERTRLAHERTLLAWVRTATSLISFGFTIYKFFQYLREGNPVPAGTHRLLDPRAVALVMISLGIVALACATLEQRRSMRRLRDMYPDHGPLPRSLSTIVAGVLAVIGVVGLVLVFLRQ